MSSHQVTRNRLVNLPAIAVADAALDPAELQEFFDIAERRGLKQGDIQSLILDLKRSPSSIPTDSLETVAHLFGLASVILADENVDVGKPSLLKSITSRFGTGEDSVACRRTYSRAGATGRVEP